MNHVRLITYDSRGNRDKESYHPSIENACRFGIAARQDFSVIELPDCEPTLYWSGYKHDSQRFDIWDYMNRAIQKDLYHHFS
jgi:hypothetical protein